MDILTNTFITLIFIQGYIFLSNKPAYQGKVQHEIWKMCTNYIFLSNEPTYLGKFDMKAGKCVQITLHM